MANTKCPKCGAWYDPKDRHICGALGGREDIGKLREGSQETGTDGDL